ncbi:hypothetical protein M758_11G128600 [Ceratodon purpureus]|nr:hypothetical protein M758_11G128600 [Ceratodon purpureus]
MPKLLSLSTPFLPHTRFACTSFRSSHHSLPLLLSLHLHNPRLITSVGVLIGDVTWLLLEWRFGKDDLGLLVCSQAITNWAP